MLAVMSLAVSGLTVALTRPAGRTAPVILTGPAGQNSGELAASHAAAIWVARQVSHNAVVACDPSICPVLQAHGFPVENLFVLRSGATDPRLSDVIMATPTVRQLIGSRLQLVSAPAVIAGFGSGEARTDIRAVAPDGAPAYRAALSADWAARRGAGAELVSNPRLHAAGAARQELLAGTADSRLLVTLAALAVSHPVTVVSFSGSDPGASAGVPIREMEVSATGSPAYHSAELQRMRSLVLAQHGVLRPAHVSHVRLAGGAALRIEFAAPDPLGLLLGSPVTQ